MKFKFGSNNYEFKPKVVPLVSFLISLTILLSLSFWQVKRLQWKTELIKNRTTSYEIDAIKLSGFNNPKNNEFRKVIVEGNLLNDKEMFMPALSKNGNNGFHILVPLKTINQKYYIYDTGWIPLRLKNKSERENNLHNTNVKLEAIIRSPGRKGYFQPENDDIKNVWFFVEPSKMSNFLSIDFEQEIYLEAYENGPNGFPIGNQTRIYLRNSHLQYALTWFFLSLGLVGVFLSSNIKKTS